MICIRVTVTQYIYIYIEMKLVIMYKYSTMHQIQIISIAIMNLMEIMVIIEYIGLLLVKTNFYLFLIESCINLSSLLSCAQFSVLLQ